MESEVGTFGNMLDSFNSKVEEVGRLRRLLDEELVEVQNFFDHKNQILGKIKAVNSQINDMFHKHLKQSIVEELRKFKYFQVEMSVAMIEELKGVVFRIKGEYQQVISQRDQELQRNYNVIRSLREEISLMKLKQTPNTNQNLNIKNQVISRGFEKQNMKQGAGKDQGETDSGRKVLRNNKNIDNIKEIFKSHRLSLDMDRGSNQKGEQSIAPFKLSKAVFGSPSDSSSSSKQELMNISPSSIKKESSSLFFDFDCNSKSKEYIIKSIPFDSDVSMEDSLGNEENVFAKLTFGKEKARCLKQELIMPKREPDREAKGKDLELLRQIKNNIYKNQQKERQRHQSNRSRNPLKSIIRELDSEPKSKPIQKLKQPKRVQQKSYLDCIRNQYTKEISNLKKQPHSFYLGDSRKQLRYQGLKRDGKKFGRGVLFYSDQLNYEGQFVNNKREGFGILKLEHMEIYSGDWENDMIQGEGRLRNCSIIRSYLGIGGEKSDRFGNWVTYIGRFKENSFDGPGELHLENGQKFIGEFSNGRAEGEGTLYKKDGQVRFGIWKSNRLVEEI